MSILSVPYKDSRPSTPSQIPLNPPRLPGYPTRTESPLRTASPVGRPTDDYFARPPSRGPSRNVTPGYTPSDIYELNSLSERSYDAREMSDSESLLHYQRSHSRDPPPSRRGGYM